MIEAEWLGESDPTPMMRFLRDKASDRKLRLAAVAVARLLSHRLPDDLRGAVDVGERVADGLASFDEQKPFVDKLYDVVVEHGRRTSQNWFLVTAPEDVSAVFSAIRAVGGRSPSRSVDTSPAWELTLRANSERHPPILRDIFGNPFRPVTAGPSWLTPDVVSLATSIYEEKAFDRMPHLADALQEAGCDSEDVLNHCRQPGEHCLGCWLVDLLLGKE